MTPQEKDRVMAILQEFVNENLGQKVTKWNGASLLGTMNDEMTKMVKVVEPEPVNRG